MIKLTALISFIFIFTGCDISLPIQGIGTANKTSSSLNSNNSEGANNLNPTIINEPTNTPSNEPTNTSNNEPTNTSNNQPTNTSNTNIPGIISADPIRHNTCFDRNEPNVEIDYYVCDCDVNADENCIAGNDNNDGLTPNSPFRSFSRARSVFNSLSPGQTIGFCQGGSWTATSERWVNPNCLASNKCEVRDYKPLWASGDEERPLINSSGTVFNLADGGSVDHEEGYIFKNLHMEGPGSQYGFFLYNDIDDVEITCNIINNFSHGVYVAGSGNTFNPGANAYSENTKIKYNTITNNEGNGILGGASGIEVINNYLYNNGFGRRILNHNIYLSAHSNEFYDQSDYKVIGNILYKATSVNGLCEGVSLVIHGRIDGILIQDNYIYEDIGAVTNNCWGIAVDTGYSDAERFRNVSIINNHVENVGRIGIGTNACIDCLIENNTIISQQSGSFTGIMAPNRAPGPGDAEISNVAIKNNNISISNGGQGIQLGDEGDNHEISNNTVHFTGPNPGECLSIANPSIVSMFSNTCN